MTGKCKRSLKFSRNDQIIANSGYSAARPVLLGRLSVFSSSGSTSLLALDAILAHSMLAPNPRWEGKGQAAKHARAVAWLDDFRWAGNIVQRSRTERTCRTAYVWCGCNFKKWFLNQLKPTICAVQCRVVLSQASKIQEQGAWRNPTPDDDIPEILWDLCFRLRVPI